MEVRGSSLFLLSGQRNHDASRSSHQNSVGSIIETIRRLGWQQLYSKSMFTWSCDCWWYLMHCLDRSKSLTFKWSDKTSISAYLLIMSYPIHSCFSSKVSDPRFHQIRSTDPFQIRYNKLLHSYPVHIMLNTAYLLHSVYLPFQYIGYAHFQLCLLIC